VRIQAVSKRECRPKNIAIIFGFKNVIPCKKEHDQFFVEINEFISLHKNALTENLSPYSFDQFTSPLMMKYLLYIAANIHESGEWDSNKTSGFVDRLAATVARIIATKASLVKSYRTTDEMWLVIQNSGRPSETVLPIHGITEFANPEINSPFSRVYVFTAMGLFSWFRGGEWQNA
jgi:hypothetical protein